jgi:hypothetical protein
MSSDNYANFERVLISLTVTILNLGLCHYASIINLKEKSAHYKNYTFRKNVTNILLKMADFWVAVSCSLVDSNWYFRGAYCLHHLGDAYAPLKCQSLSTKLHVTIFQKTIIFILGPCENVRPNRYVLLFRNRLYSERWILISERYAKQ